MLKNPYIHRATETRYSHDVFINLSQDKFIIKLPRTLWEGQRWWLELFKAFQSKILFTKNVNLGKLAVCRFNCTCWKLYVYGKLCILRLLSKIWNLKKNTQNEMKLCWFGTKLIWRIPVQQANDREVNGCKSLFYFFTLMADVKRKPTVCSINISGLCMTEVKPYIWFYDMSSQEQSDGWN